MCLVAQLYQIFATPWTVAYQAPLSMEILQARMLEWVAMPSCRGSSRPRDRTWVAYVSCIGRHVLSHQRPLGNPRMTPKAVTLCATA